MHCWNCLVCQKTCNCHTQTCSLRLPLPLFWRTESETKISESSIFTFSFWNKLEMFPVGKKLGVGCSVNLISVREHEDLHLVFHFGFSGSSSEKCLHAHRQLFFDLCLYCGKLWDQFLFDDHVGKMDCSSRLSSLTQIIHFQMTILNNVLKQISYPSSDQSIFRGLRLL